MKTTQSNLVPLCLALTLALCFSAPAAESFWQKVLRITGVSATSSLQKGVEEDLPAGGQIWIANLETAQTRKLTDESQYRSPVFTPDGRTVLALKSNEIWRIPLAGGSPEKLRAIPDLAKLIGFSQDDTNQLCVLVQSERQVVVALVALGSGQTTRLEYDKADRQDRLMVAQLKGWERHYGGVTVYCARQRKKGLSGDIEWNDIFVSRGVEKPINVSQTQGVNCGHPTLSASGGEVAFVKAPP